MRNMWCLFTIIIWLCIVVPTNGNDVQPVTPKSSKKSQAAAITSPDLQEISGVVASRKNPGLLWVHNDSGDYARIFAIDLNGNLVRECKLKKTLHQDWEDIAIGPGPKKGKPYLYIGDIGDNRAARSSITVYRVQEPTLNPAQKQKPLQLAGVEKIRLKYPDGPRDAETLLIDPLTGDLFIVTKRDRPARVYHAAAPLSTTKINTLSYIGNLSSFWISGGDISQSGSLIILRTNSRAYCWQRAAGKTIATVLQQKPTEHVIQGERQGEAIGFDISEKNFYTIAEKQPAVNCHLLP